MKKIKVEQVESRMQVLIEKIKDDNYQYTPEKLRCDMVTPLIGEKDKKVLVIRNLEFIESLYKVAGFPVENIYYSAPSQIMKEMAIHMGIPENQVSIFEYNNSTVNFGTRMEFDIIIQNPPYNPNSLWKKFVQHAISHLKPDGKMIAIHPDSWRNNSQHTKLVDLFREKLSELHITDFDSFPGVGISTDWYVYSASGSETCKVVYPTGESEVLDLKKCDNIIRFSPTSIPGKILAKITSSNNNGAILLNGFDEVNYPPSSTGVWRQCGGGGGNTRWTTGDFNMTDNPTRHQFENKVVMSYVRKPRAQFFSSEDAVGVIRAYYWLTDNTSLPLLLNSKIIEKLGICLTPEKTGFLGLPRWFLYHLNFEGLTAQTEEELYQHYGLTQEEIDWINE